MGVSAEDIYALMQSLDSLKEKFTQVKEERDRLLDANTELVRLVEMLDDELLEREHHEMKQRALDLFKEAGYEYSYEDGWQPKDVAREKALDIEEHHDVQDIDRQIKEIREIMEQIRNYKNQ